jgi:hypothetical protein
VPPPTKRPPNKPSAEAEEEGPSTFYVRMDPEGNPIDQPPAEEAPMKAPKKGLQVQLPDDDDDAKKAPPPPKAKPAAAAPTDRKGRRGNWWEHKDEPEPEPEPEPETEPIDEAPPSEDDVPGGTAILRVDEPPPPPPRRRAPPRVEPEPEQEEETEPRGRHEPAQDNRTQFLQVNNAPTPEEWRQQKAHEAAQQAHKSGVSQQGGGGWSAWRVAAILLGLALFFGVIAGALAVFHK